MSSPSNDHFGHNSPLFGASGSPARDKAVEVSIESLPHYTRYCKTKTTDLPDGDVKREYLLHHFNESV